MNNQSESRTACDPTLSRAQFIRLLIERATLAGVIAAVPSIADSFMAPPAVAAVSGSGGGQTSTSLTFPSNFA